LKNTKIDHIQENTFYMTGLCLRLKSGNTFCKFFICKMMLQKNFKLFFKYTVYETALLVVAQLNRLFLH